MGRLLEESMRDPVTKNIREIPPLPESGATPEAVAEVLTPEVIRQRLVFCPRATTDVIDFEPPYSPGFILIQGSRSTDREPANLADRFWLEGRSTEGVEIGSHFMQSISSPQLFPYTRFRCQIITEMDTPDLYYSVLSVLGANSSDVQVGLSTPDTGPALLQEDLNFPERFLPEPGQDE